MYLDIQFIFIEVEVLNDVFIEAKRINNVIECTKMSHSDTTRSRVKRIFLLNKDRTTKTISKKLILKNTILKCRWKKSILFFHFKTQ